MTEEYIRIPEPQAELIETYWNVDGNNRRQNRERQSELIETYWNVDYYHN